MKKKIVQAYLWNEIIQLGFMPEAREVNEWYKKYLIGLSNFLEIAYPKLPSSNGMIRGTVENQHLDLWIEYEFNKSNGHLHISFNHLNGNIWEHHIDPQYYGIPLEELLEKHEIQRSITIASNIEENLKEVLDAMLFHPREHQHFKSPIDEHFIRIGGGLPNPFLYLFHLRYQFCLPKKMKKIREPEILRLQEIFKAAIKKRRKVSVDELMAQPDIS
jgi:hypothetical protein